MLSNWQQIKDYLNTKEIGQIINRKELHKIFVRLVDTGTYKYNMGVPETTLDTVRNELTRAGFLKIVGRGKYELVAKVPTDMTLNECWLLYKGNKLGYLESKYKRNLRKKKS